MNALQILKDMVAIPSVNPMRAGAAEAVERGMTDYLESLLRAEGIDCERQLVADGRENLIASIAANVAGDGATFGGLLLNSHMDTVPTANMTILPFEPIERDGKLYGRGSCDAKGPLAAMLTAFIRHARRPRRERPVILLATVDEEFSFSGSRKFVERNWPLSAAVVGEPTSLASVIAHKGIARWRIRVWGVSAHGATPELGHSAIYDAARIGLLLEEYAKVITSKTGHSLLGKPTLNVGRIWGGQAVNMVPDLCEFEIDRRLLPEEDGLETVRDCEAWLRQRVSSEVRFEVQDPFLLDPALDTPSDSRVVQALASSRLAVLGSRGNCQGAHYGTDGSKLARVGIETVVCGPGQIAQAHTKDEFIEINQLENAVHLYEDLIEKWI